MQPPPPPHTTTAGRLEARSVSLGRRQLHGLPSSPARWHSRRAWLPSESQTIQPRGSPIYSSNQTNIKTHKGPTRISRVGPGTTEGQSSEVKVMDSFGESRSPAE